MIAATLAQEERCYFLCTRYFQSTCRQSLVPLSLSSCVCLSACLSLSQLFSSRGSTLGLLLTFQSLILGSCFLAFILVSQTDKADKILSDCPLFLVFG